MKKNEETHLPLSCVSASIETLPFQKPNLHTKTTLQSSFTGNFHQQTQKSDKFCSFGLLVGNFRIEREKEKKEHL